MYIYIYIYVYCTASCSDVDCSHYKVCEVGYNDVPRCQCERCTTTELNSGKHSYSGPTQSFADILPIKLIISQLSI